MGLIAKNGCACHVGCWPFLGSCTSGSSRHRRSKGKGQWANFEKIAS